MLDPRIYRTGLVPVVLAVIVLAFSLQDQPGALGTSLAPDAYSGQNAFATMSQLAARYPNRRPGSWGDRQVAAYVAEKLRSNRLAVSTDLYPARTVAGDRLLENVVGVEAGVGRGTIVIVSHRDALGRPGRAELSGTAVMIELARVLAGQTEQHTIVLASTSGSVGAAGVTRLLRALPQPVDAVIVLGDLAGARASGRVVVPWSDAQTVAPPALRNTVASALRAQGIPVASAAGLGGQIAHLAFPMSSSEQAPFDTAGEPAVLVSLSGERAPAGNEPTTFNQIAASGRAILQAVNALDAGPSMAAPSSYLIWSGKVVPAWAIRLLVLCLILPVAAATLDGVARSRRRGQPVGAWVTWVLSSALPFVLAGILVDLVHGVGLIGFAPAIPVHGGSVALGTAGLIVLALLGLVLIAGLAWLRPTLLTFLGPPPRSRVDPLAGAASGVMLVLCVVAFLVWVGNPFAALLLVPALHLWLWVVVPDVRLPRPALAALLAAGLAPPILVAIYGAGALGLGPVGLAWSWILLVAGGGLGWAAVLEWSALIGCAISVGLIALRRARAPRPEPAPVTVRGPVTYAGPGSLGGTESALRH